MCKKFLWVALIILVLGVFNSAMGAVLVHYSFDGNLGEALPESLQDDTGHVTFLKVEVTGTVTYGEANPFYNSGGTSAQFTRNSTLWRDAVVGADILDLDGPAYTVELFLRVNDFAGSPRGHDVIFKKMPEDYVMEVREEGSLRYAHYEWGGDSTIDTDAGTIVLDQWYHIAFVFDSSATDSEFQKIYINGEKAAAGGVSDLAPGSDGPVGIGAMTREDLTRQDWLAANIDEFRISDEALQPSEFLLNQAFDEGMASHPIPGRLMDLCPDDVTEICWRAGKWADSHDVYFGTDINNVTDATTDNPLGVYKGNQEPNCFETSGIELGTTYYWRIDEVNDVCDPSGWEGSVWQFSMNDGRASDPFPGEGVRIIPGTLFTWSAGCDATSHDVYFGTDETAVTNATPSVHPGLEYDNVSEPNYTPTLSAYTTYYWRVDEIGNGTGDGDVWMFRTGLGGVIMYYKFDGSVGNTITGPVIDDSGNNVVFTKYASDGGTVKYGESNPVIDASTASAAFDPNSGLFRADTGENDILRLDGTQYTIEMWLKPLTLNEDHDDIMLIGKRNEYSWSIMINDPDPGENNTQYRWFHAGDDESMYDDSAVAGEWAHLAAVFEKGAEDGDSMKFYLNGVLEADGNPSALNPADDVNAVTIAMREDLDDGVPTGGYTGFFDGLIDELRIQDVALAPCEFLLSPGPEWAICPDPYDTERDVDPNVVLSWTPGISAATHDVYLGTDHNDVRDATTATAGIYLGRVSDNNSSAIGTPTLEVETTYYWRVDEINGGTYKGVVWSFRTPSPILDENLRAWYKLDEDQGTDAYDSSGYGHQANVDAGNPDWDPADGEFGGSLGFDDNTDVEMPSEVLDTLTHAITVTTWLKDADRPGTNNWVFSASNGDAVVEAAVVGADGSAIWRAGGDVNDIITWDLDDQNPGDIDGWHFWAFVKDEVSGSMSIYFDGKVVESNDVVDTDTLAGVARRQMRIGAGPGQSNTFIGRVDDFRVYDRALSTNDIVSLFRGGNVELAWAPEPGDNAKNVARDAALTWSPGDFAFQHDVYFGTDVDAVTDANTDVTLGVYIGRQAIDANTYDPTGDFPLNTTYYWRIDEVNDACAASPWKGKIWRFTTANYIIIDSFETYTSDNEMYVKWNDGWINDTGSTLLLSAAGDPTHTGEKSMLYSYNNVGSPYYSEAERVLGAGEQDFTETGVKLLTMYFYGKSTNTATTKEQLYAGLDDGGTYAEVRYGVQEGESITDIQLEDWTEWNVDLNDFTDVTLSSVDGLFVGFGSRSASSAGGTGLVFFDDIRLSPPRCVAQYAPEYDFSTRLGRDNECTVDLADVGVMAEEWLRADACLPATAPGTGPVGWWKLEQNANDSSGNSYNGTAEGDYEWVAGKVDSYAVDLSGGWVYVADAGATPKLRPSSNTVSVMAWIKLRRSVEDDTRVVIKGRNDHEGYGLEVNPDGGLTFLIRDPNGEKESVDSESSLPIGAWVHVAGTYDGNNLVSYVDGDVDLSNQIGAIVLMADVNDGLGIGGRWDDTSSSGRFPGTIDEARVYDYGLSAANVAYVALGPSGYKPVTAMSNIYNKEAPEHKAVNFKDFALLMTKWLEKKLWPE